MKKTLFNLVLCSIPFLGAGGQAIPENDNRLMDSFINSKTTIEKVKMESDTLKKVFRGSFYEITPFFEHINGSSSCGSYKIVINNGVSNEIEATDETKPMSILFSLLQPGFTIRNETDAKIFEVALDHLYPLSWSDKAEDKKHQKINNKWLFLRGDFFESKKGFVVTLDQSSKITSIDFDLEAVKKE
jgi:hypothetical protein